METLSIEEFKKRYGTVGLAAAKQPGYFDRLKSAASEGVKKITTGQGQFSGSPNVYNQVSGALKGAAGLAETVSSPVTAFVEPITKPTIGRIVNYTADKISDSPNVQRFANSKVGQVFGSGVEDINNANTVLGAIAGPKLGKTGVSKITGAIESRIENIPKLPTGSGGGGVVSGLKNVGEMAINGAKRIPERISTNVAERQAFREVVDSLPSNTAKNAARDGIDINDIRSLYKIAPEQKGSLKKLAQVVKDFAEGNTSKNPIEMIGQPIVKKLRELEKQGSRIGQQLSKTADTLGVVTTNELAPTVINKLKKVPGLEGLNVNRKGVLDFKNTVLATAETASDRKAIQSIFNTAIRWGTGKKKHLLRQELFEALGGKKRSKLNLTATQEKAYSAIRAALSDVLDKKNPTYKALNNQYRKTIKPLNELRKKLNVEGDEDIMDMSAGLLSRRITSLSKSGPEIEMLLEALDRATTQKGKVRLSTKTLQNFYNILDKYYDINPKTAFQSQVKQGVEKAVEGPMSYIGEQIKGFAGETPAVRQRALEKLLKEILD